VSGRLALPARCASSVAGRYGVILADPPWQFRVWATSDKAHGSAEAHYRTMSTQEIAAMPVAELAAPDCALFMWATWPTLPDALDVARAWGFTYKTLGFIWVKRTPNGNGWHTGLGYWTRANSEPCLLFTRGTPRRKSRRISQVIADVGQLELLPPLIAPVGGHSAKPHDQYSRIESLLNGPYLELFARNSAPGWDAWGNEAPNCIDWRPVRRREAA